MKSGTGWKAAPAASGPDEFRTITDPCGRTRTVLVRSSHYETVHEPGRWEVRTVLVWVEDRPHIAPTASTTDAAATVSMTTAGADAAIRLSAAITCTSLAGPTSRSRLSSLAPST
ncbi:MAG: hypothetical protein R3E96_05180 [Planctomycetota bacterium]